MAICTDCGREMLAATTCTIESFAFPDGRILSRIPFGSEKPRWRMERCGDCGVNRGGYHHQGCDIEQCPACLQQFLSCGCADEEDESSTIEDESAYVDVPAAIEIISRLIRQDPGIDHIFMDPIAVCGHVGRGHIQEMVRGGDLPLDEWFELGGARDADAAAVLFTCRSRNFENIDEGDLDLARAMAAYAAMKATLPWELVFVTQRGNFNASDL